MTDYMDPAYRESVDDILIDYVRANPGVGLMECSEHLLNVVPELFVRVTDPKCASRKRACTRLRSLTHYGYIRAEKGAPRGRHIFFIKED